MKYPSELLSENVHFLPSLFLSRVTFTELDVSDWPVKRLHALSLEKYSTGIFCAGHAIFLMFEELLEFMEYIAM